jgi:hypothetical protein
MFRKTLLTLALAAAPTCALAQQPAQTPAKPAHAAAARADSTKAKRHRARHAAKPKPAAAAPRDTTARP